jgi:hypothetical protein
LKKKFIGFARVSSREQDVRAILSTFRKAAQGLFQTFGRWLDQDAVESKHDATLRRLADSTGNDLCWTLERRERFTSDLLREMTVQARPGGMAGSPAGVSPAGLMPVIDVTSMG